MLINSYRCCIVISRLLNLIKVKQLGFAPPAVIISSTCHFLISVPLWMNTKLWWSNLRCIRKCCEHETTVVAAYVSRFIFRFSLRFRIIHPSVRPSMRADRVKEESCFSLFPLLLFGFDYAGRIFLFRCWITTRPFRSTSSSCCRCWLMAVWERRFASVVYPSFI